MKHITVFGLILLLALALRLYNLDTYNLGYDEATTVLDERGLDKLPSFDKLLDADFLVQNNDYLILYNHGFVYYWQKLFGKSEMALRLSSVIFSLLSICLLYFLGKEIFGFKTACLAIFLLAISPLNIYHSQELRPYAAVSFFTLMAVYSFSKILKNGKKRYFFIYAASNVLNAYFHYMTVMVLLSFCVFYIFNLKKYRHLLKPFLIMHSAIIFLLIPIFSTLYFNLRFFLQNVIDPDFNDFPTWAGKISFRNLLFTFKNFSIGYNTDYFSFIGRCSTLILFLLFLFGVFKFRKKIETRLFLFCLLVPILSVFFISGIRTWYVDRYFSFVLAFYLLFIAAGLAKLNNRILSVLAITAVIIFNFFGLKNYYTYALPKEVIQHVGIPGRQNIKMITKIILENYKEGDRIMHTCRNTIFPLKFYMRQLCPNPDLIKEVDRGTIIFIPDFLKNGRIFTYGYSRLHPNPVLSSEYKIADGLKNIDRLWLVFSNWYFMDSHDKESKVLKILEEKFNVDRVDELEGSRLYLLNIKQDGNAR